MKKYTPDKHILDAKKIIDLCFSQEWVLKGYENYFNYGIRKSQGKAIRKEEKLKQYIFTHNLSDEADYTLIENVEILAQKENWFTLANIKRLFPDFIFVDCKFPNLALHDMQLCSRVEDREIEHLTNLYFINCEIESISSQRSILGKFYFENSTCENITIANSKVKEFTLSKSMGAEINFSNSEIGNLSTSGVFDRINIVKQSKVGNLGLGGAFIEVTINESETKEILSINNSLAGNFWFQNSIITSFRASNLCCRLSFNQTNISNVRLENCHFSVLQILGSCKMDMFFSGGSIDLVDFRHIILSKENNISFYGMQMYAVLMEEFTAVGLLFFRNVGALKKPYTDFEKVKTTSKQFTDQRLVLKIKEVSSSNKKNYLGEHKKLDDANAFQPTFRIFQSSLGRTEFTECDLASFNFEYDNSKITEIFIMGGSIPYVNDNIENSPHIAPRIIKRTEEGLKTQIIWHEQRLSVFNQLKKVFSQQGNTYFETDVNSRALYHQLHILRNSKQLRQLRHINSLNQRGLSNILHLYKIYVWILDYSVIIPIGYLKKKIIIFKNKFPDTNTLDIIVFRLNQFSNKHGASWGRALVFVLVMPFFIYLGYLNAAGLLHFNIHSAVDWDLLGNYFTVLNPTHKTDFMPSAYPVGYNFWTNFLDFFGRIIVGYGIYQFISAFRRHGKRG